MSIKVPSNPKSIDVETGYVTIDSYGKKNHDGNNLTRCRKSNICTLVANLFGRGLASS